MRKTVKTRCSFCKKNFQKDIREFNRNKKIKRTNFCSLSCVGKASIERWRTPCRYPYLAKNFKNKAYSKPLDGFSPFRNFFRHLKERCKRKKRQLENTVTLQDLKTQWEKQNGICPYTGWKLILPISTSKWLKGKNLQRASIDRVNCQKGYVKENIQFVCKMANWGKYTFSDHNLYNFCKIVTCYQSLKNNDFINNNPDVENQEDNNFSKYLKYATKSKKHSNISIKALRDQWYKQNGRCTISGIKLKHSERGIQVPFQASLDRIDSTQGYKKGNIQFTCLIANFAKNSYSNEDLIDFCKAVSYNHSQTRSTG